MTPAFPPQMPLPEATQCNLNLDKVIFLLHWMFTEAIKFGVLLKGTTAGVSKVNHQ